MRSRGGADAFAGAIVWMLRAVGQIIETPNVIAVAAPVDRAADLVAFGCSSGFGVALGGIGGFVGCPASLAVRRIWVIDVHSAAWPEGAVQNDS